VKEFVSVFCLLIAGLLIFKFSIAAGEAAESPILVDSVGMTATWASNGAAFAPSPPSTNMTPFSFNCAPNQNGQAGQVEAGPTTLVNVSCAAYDPQGYNNGIQVGMLPGTTQCAPDSNGNPQIALGFEYSESQDCFCDETDPWGNCLHHHCYSPTAECYLACASFYTPASLCKWSSSSTFSNQQVIPKAEP
jgi:hypothetical protein